MSYREVAMWEVLSVLRRIGRGETKSAVARTTGHDRKTVGRYLATAVELGWRPGTDEPTEALAAAVAARHSPARNRGVGEIEELLLPHRERINECVSASSLIPRTAGVVSCGRWWSCSSSAGTSSSSPRTRRRSKT